MRAGFKTNFTSPLAAQNTENTKQYNKSINMPFDIEKCARPNILALEPYRCARECVSSILAVIITSASTKHGP
jgi:hypothetical protein